MNKSKLISYLVFAILFILVCFAVVYHKAIFSKVNATFFDKNEASSKKVENKAIVYYLNGKKVKIISGMEKNESLNVPDKLIIPSGIYHFFEEKNAYDLTQEGLYRFVQPGKINSQKIVYRNDLDALLSAFSWIVSHGVSDDGKEYQQLTEKAQKTKLFLTCGNISKWTHNWLSTLGIKSRIVGGVAAGDYNDYDNGHRLIEVWREERNKWVVYDLDNNYYFTDTLNNYPLSLVEFSSRVVSKNYNIMALSQDARIDISGFHSSKGYDYSFFAEAMNADIKSWYARVMEVALIYDEHKYYFADKLNKETVKNYMPKYRYIEKAEFMKRFYNN